MNNESIGPFDPYKHGERYDYFLSRLSVKVDAIFNNIDNSEERLKQEWSYANMYEELDNLRILNRELISFLENEEMLSDFTKWIELNGEIDESM